MYAFSPEKKERNNSKIVFSLKPNYTRSRCTCVWVNVGSFDVNERLQGISRWFIWTWTWNNVANRFDEMPSKRTGIRDTHLLFQNAQPHTHTYSRIALRMNSCRNVFRFLYSASSLSKWWSCKRELWQNCYTKRQSLRLLQNHFIPFWKFDAATDRGSDTHKKWTLNKLIQIFRWRGSK